MSFPKVSIVVAVVLVASICEISIANATITGGRTKVFSLIYSLQNLLR
jgi:hypothetical protein